MAVKIFCPKCEWKPPRSALWWCSPRMGGCGHKWHTFDTGGICPNCNYVWEITACFSCKQYSLHVEWYYFPEDPQAENEEKSVDLEMTETR